MKFGKTFLSHQIPEWSIFYMNYKNLKKVIKNIDYDFNPSEMEISDLIQNILSQFYYQLDRNIEKVDTFYNNKFNEYDRRLTNIKNLLGFKDNKVSHEINSSDELDEIISILLELKNFFRNLKWFGELNHKGFIKILKKLDKKLDSLTNLSNNHIESHLISLPTNNKENYLSTRVDALPFANEIDLINNLETINTILNQLSYKEFSQQSDNVKPVTRNDNLVNNFDNLYLSNFSELIENDNDVNLIEELNKIPKIKQNLKFLISLLIKATIKNSLKCIDSIFNLLLTYLKENNLSTDNLLYDKFDINGRNFFHNLILSFGKLLDSNNNQNLLKTVVPGEQTSLKKLYDNNSGTDGAKLITFELTGFTYILDKINGNVQYHNLKFLLNAKDNYLRTPLHYSSQFGIKNIIKLILEYLNSWNLINNISIDDVKFWGDQENLTPIHLSIIGKHPKTTEYLLVYSNTKKLTCLNLILLAVRLNSSEILKALITLGKIDIDYTDFEHNNETCLFIAAKLNYPEVVEFLLNNHANTEIGEMVFGWTPIFVAASEGYEEVVRLLVNGGCKFDMVDDSGWLPMEHAVLRGHLDVANLIKPSNDKLLLYDINNPDNNLQRIPVSSQLRMEIDNSLVLTPTNSSSIDILPESTKNNVNEVYKQLKQFDSTSSVEKRSRSKSPMNVKKIKPIKSFGHSFLSNDESVLLITLGTTDLRDNTKPIELNNVSLSKNLITELDTALSLVVTCRNKLDNESVEPPVIIDLPLEDHHGSATDPITFKLTNNLTTDDIVITFDIVPTYQYNNQTEELLVKENKILGRAVAFPNDAYTKVGPNLRSLNSVITSPILESKTLNVLGSVKFEFLCVKSFNHPNLKIGRSDTYWKQLVSTRVIGHRGLGKNVNDKKSLQLGENTVESFIAAASLGASYVEFDVQLTKDGTPVIYHDFTVAESGVDIPMHALTTEQFLHLSDDDFNPLHHITNGDKSPYLHSSNNTSEDLSSPSTYALDDEILSKVNRPRSMAGYKSTPNMNHHNVNDNEEEDEIDKEVRDQINRRMKLTKTWKDKGYKGNARGLSIASNFVTLKDLFKRIPKNVGFNIEIKYPMLDEAQLESMGEIAYDINYYVDTILKSVYDENVTGRDIIFSSFHPDVCVLLSLKQPTIPILYLTESGTTPMADIRASSLQNAIRFSKKWNLLGIVSAADTFIMTPRLAQVVKSSGLVCVTYGTANNSPENCKIQMKAGVDAVIADKVLAVREGLRKDEVPAL